MDLQNLNESCIIENIVEFVFSLLKITAGTIHGNIKFGYYYNEHIIRGANYLRDFSEKVMK
jgi:hypothetical protein